jgi:hypothetical protein
MGWGSEIRDSKKLSRTHFVFLFLVYLKCYYFQHTLLLTSRGEVLAFGDNTDGQCGHGEMKSKTGQFLTLT